MREKWISVDLGAGISAFFTTRAGGVSEGDFRGLNLSSVGGDSPEAVKQNRLRVSEKIGAPLVGMRQVHGGQVARVSASNLTKPAPEADGLITTDPSVALPVLVAHCVPVLLADPQAGIVGAAHAGRRGVAQEVVPATVRRMQDEGAQPERVRAAIGPSICGRCYEVPGEMRLEMAAQIPASFAETSWGRPSVDLPEAVEAQLKQIGVKVVSRVDICTFEEPSLYSYRASPVTGRFGGVIRLKK